MPIIITQYDIKELIWVDKTPIITLLEGFAHGPPISQVCCVQYVQGNNLHYYTDLDSRLSLGPLQ